MTHSGPEVLFKTCVAMKFMVDYDDDDDDNDDDDKEALFGVVWLQTVQTA